MFKKGDKVKIDPGSEYFGRENQLPVGVHGVVSSDQRTELGWIGVKWPGRHNSYRTHDLIKVVPFKGNK